VRASNAIPQETRLFSSPDQASDQPRHIAIIMDGNGRWARRRLLPRIEGHRQGAKSVRKAVEYCRRRGIGVLTLYAFSTENWQRPKSEVSGLMELLSQYLESELDELHSNDIKLMTIGNLSSLPRGLKTRIEAAIDKTRDNSSTILNIALSYGGRRDIVNAAVKLSRALKSGHLAESEVTEEMFSGCLATAGLPDPDLLIRTGGELRISNFLLWQCAYSELYFTPTLWPDFDESAMDEAVQAFRSRQRRFGKTSEQVEAGQGAV